MATENWEGTIILKYDKQENGLVWKEVKEKTGLYIEITKQTNKNPEILCNLNEKIRTSKQSEEPIWMRTYIEPDHLRQLIVWAETGKAPNVIVKDYEDTAEMKTGTR